MNDLTPAMRQYAEQKQQVGDALLLFRMGDFYEMFYEDAKTASRVLGITLTSRSKSENPIPLAGIPHHALTSYLRRLVNAGFRVAISEQVEDPKLAKGVVRREIVRIVTPGTLTDDALLDKGEDNILAAICVQGTRLGLATIELASGRFHVLDPDRKATFDEIVRLRPAEILVDEEAFDERRDGELRRWVDELKSLCGTTAVRRPAYEFSEHQAHQTLCDHFGVATLSGFGLENVDESLRAAGAVVSYLRETQRTPLGHITKIARPPSERRLLIDHNSWRALEVERTLRGQGREGSLLLAIDRTVHPIGRRRLRHWLSAPLRTIDEITARQDAVAAFVEAEAMRQKLRKILRSLADVERIAARIALLRASPRDLVGLGASLDELPALQNELVGIGPPLLRQALESCTGLTDLAEHLRRALRSDCPPTFREGGVIADGYDAEVDRLRAIGRDGQAWLAEYQKREIDATGIAGLKVGFNRIFGYYLEVSHAQGKKVSPPPHFVRRQTVRNAERYITDELKHHEEEVLTAEQRAIERETQLFEELRRQVSADVPRLQQVAEAIGTFDVVAALAELAVSERYVRPTITEDLCLRIVGGRHPVLDQLLKNQFVPNDCDLSNDGGRVLLITGPNMAGKSTYIRQVALILLLAQIGSYVPAESMIFSPADRIFARVGSSDEIARGQSTFMVEMSESANILNNATDQSLVVLDELGRGTSTFDGLSLAWAITEHLIHEVRCRTLVATHYHELTQLADHNPQVRNFNVAVREWTHRETGEAQLVFLHKIVPGAADKSYGVHVARLAGVPPQVIDRSRQILRELERGSQRKALGSHFSAPGESQLPLFQEPVDLSEPRA